MRSPIEIIRDLQSRKVVAIHIVQVTEQDIADIQKEAFECGRARGLSDAIIEVKQYDKKDDMIFRLIACIDAAHDRSEFTLIHQRKASGECGGTGEAAP